MPDFGGGGFSGSGFGGGFGGMDPGILNAMVNAKNSLGNFLWGAFGPDQSAPFQGGMDELQKYFQEAKGYQQPFWNMGVGAIPQYQDWLKGMQNPSGFINNLMGQYQESPWAKYSQQQGLRAAQNMGSGSGLAGSTPLMQFAEQQAQDISSKDMNQWLQNVLGINTQYGQGLGNEIQGGMGAANAMSNLAGQFGGDIAKTEIARQLAQQQQQANTWGGLFNILL